MYLVIQEDFDLNDISWEVKRKRKISNKNLLSPERGTTHSVIRGVLSSYIKEKQGILCEILQAKKEKISQSDKTPTERQKKLITLLNN